MADVLILRAAIGLERDGNTLAFQELCHGGSSIPEEIVVGCGQMDGREPVCDMVQHLKPGVIGRELTAQIVPGDALTRPGRQTGGII